MEYEPEVAGLPAGSLEDKDLAIAFKNGEDGAYQAIHDRYSQRVYSVCRRMLGPHDAEEAAQETFLRIYQALARFNGRYQLGPWIARIATNVCLDQLRAKSRRPSNPVPNEILVLDETPDDFDSEPERMVIRNAEGRRVRRILASLPPMHRAAIVLRDFEGLSYEEVAIALQITDSQVKALIHRARQNFKRSWTQSVSVLLPWRLVHRFRALDGTARDHGAEAMTVAQGVSSCGGMLQQCSQYVGQHVATVVTAAIVGTAAGAASHAVTQPSRPDESNAKQIVATAETPLPDGGRKVSPQAAPKKVVVEAPSTEQGTTEPQPVIVEPSPAPTEPIDQSPQPTPSDDASAGSGAQPSPMPSETQPAPPPPFHPAVGFDYGRPVKGRAPTAHSATVSCSKDVLSQRLETVVDDDDSAVTYPALLQMSWGSHGSALSLELTVWKNGREIYYSGTGELVDGSYSDQQRKLEFMGNYGTLNPDAKNMDLPVSGRFSAGLTLDCAALSVITESVVLGW